MNEKSIPMEQFEPEMGVEKGRTEKLYEPTDQLPAAKWYHVDVTMISSKLAYFFQNGKDACYLPYMILFLTGIGLTPEQAGTINGIRFVAYITGAPVWGILADHTGKHLLVIIVLCGASFALMVSQPFVALPFIYQISNVSRNLSGSLQEPELVHANLKKVSFFGNKTLTAKNNEKLISANGHLFVFMITLNVLFTWFDGATQGFVDAGVMKKISSYPSRTIDFGTTRLFGAIGFGTGTFTSSLAIEYLAIPSLPAFSQVFLVYGFLILSLMGSTYFLYRTLVFAPNIRKQSEENDGVEIHSSASVGQLLRQALKKISIQFFFATILFVGVIHGIYLSFVFVLLKEIKCPNIVMGLSICTASLSSVIGIKFCENAIKLLHGTFQVLCLCTFTWAVRFFAYYYLWNPFFVLPIQLLQGLGYGMFIAVAAVHIKTTCKPEIYASMFGILNGLFFGGGLVFGNVIGGSVVMRLGIRPLCLGCSIASMVWTLIMLLYLLIRFCCKKPN